MSEDHTVQNNKSQINVVYTVKVLFLASINFCGLVKNYKFVDYVFVPK
jgi:hypothetical protein